CPHPGDAGRRALHVQRSSGCVDNIPNPLAVRRTGRCPRTTGCWWRPSPALKPSWASSRGLGSSSGRLAPRRSFLRRRGAGIGPLGRAETDAEQIDHVLPVPRDQPKPAIAVIAPLHAHLLNAVAAL